MSNSNIPIIEPTIDYTKVPPIHQKRTISFINHFVVNTVSFLNKLALTCEEKLYELENKLQRVEAAVVILESRLASIPGLENKTPAELIEPAEPSKDNPEPKVEEEPIKEETVKEETNSPTEVTKDVDETDKEIPDSQLRTQEDNLIPICKHPLYEQYFRLVNVGVPKVAVKLKMTVEKLDPSILDDPQRKVPKPETEAAAAE